MRATRRDFLRAAAVPAAKVLGSSGGSGPQNAVAGSRPRFPLNGTWEFRTDHGNVGIRNRWYSDVASYPDSIEVPGCWQAQGIGPPNGHLRHDYQGKAWHRGAVKVPPDWNGKRVWLYIGGAANTVRSSGTYREPSRHQRNASRWFLRLSVLPAVRRSCFSRRTSLGKARLSGTKLRPIVGGLSTGPHPQKTAEDWSRPENRWMLYRHGIIYEGRIGEGGIVVSVLHVLAGIREKHPEAEYLLNCLINYGLSERSAPASQSMQAEEARRAFTIVAS